MSFLHLRSIFIYRVVLRDSSVTLLELCLRSTNWEVQEVLLPWELLLSLMPWEVFCVTLL